MSLKEIAAIAGKPGLYRIVKSTRTGFIVEALGQGGKKMVIDAHQRVSILQEIAIYVHSARESVPLSEVLQTIRQQYEGALEVNVSDQAALMELLENVLPDYDRGRVYASDVKKLVNWYNLILANFPELLDTPAQEDAQTTPDAQQASAE